MPLLPGTARRSARFRCGAGKSEFLAVIYTSQLVFPKILAAALIAVLIAGCSAKAKQERDLRRADGYFKAGEYDKAKIEYLNLLRKDPQNVTAIQQLGVIWSEQGAPLRAFPFLIKAKEAAPDNLDTRLKLAIAYLSAGQVDDARKEVLAILQESPSHDEAVLLLADTARGAEEVVETEQHLQEYGNREKASFHLASANLFLRKGDVPSAESSVQRAMTLDPKSQAAHLAMATLFMVQKKPELAGEQFKIAADLSPIRSNARLKYAQFKAESGKVEEARALLKDITRQAPDYLPAWGFLARVAVQEKKYDEALAFVENLLTRDPQNFDARLLQGQLYLAIDEVTKALEGLEKLNTAYPNIPAVKYYLARAYLQTNNPTLAIAAVTQALAVNPNYEEALLLLAELNLHAGDPQAAVAAMEGLLKVSPGLMQAQLILAEAYRSLGRLEDAAEIFRQQIQADPKLSTAYILLGKILRQQNQPDNARKTFETARELAPEDMSVFAEIVDLDLLQKSYDAALQRVQEQVRKTPASAAVYYLEAKIYWAQGQWDNAEAALLKSLELDANSPAPYELLISSYISAKKLPEATARLEALLAKTPENIQARMLLALIYEKLDDTTKARDTYEKLLSLKPDFVAALNNVAYLYAVRLNQLDKAYGPARKARALQSEDPAIADTLGWVLYKRGEYQPALALLQESASKLPDEPEIQFHLGMASYMMGQTETAATALRNAAKSSKNFPGKEEIARRLALLGDGTAESTDLSSSTLETMLKETPGDILAWLRLGECHEKEGAFAKAVVAYGEALKLNPNLLSATTKLAQLHAGPLQSPDKALNFAKKARELAPGDPKAAALLGSIAYQTGNFTWAYSLLQEGARQPGADVTILHDLAWASYALGKVSEARQAMQRILQEAPNFGKADDVNSFLAMTALEQNPTDLAAGAHEIEKILKADPAYAPAQMAQAAIHLQRGEAQPAAAIYVEILRRFPDFAPAQKRLAILYLEDPANRAKAYDLAVKARKALPNDLELAEILAEISRTRSRPR